ncbi:eukaryotic aspartyl protease family protein [Actinidia rufa]|uniref:Eukaryotic aspartyl protease family protein n=1 Tax=Actinidia rufa TaxID=165716 RepID=A0A7J0F3G2_9ERIC|nr:eukaryotic aspartyl protease family protein [Actinidia rufa]
MVILPLKPNKSHLGPSPGSLSTTTSPSRSLSPSARPHRTLPWSSTQAASSPDSTATPPGSNNEHSTRPDQNPTPRRLLLPHMHDPDPGLLHTRLLRSDQPLPRRAIYPSSLEGNLGVFGPRRPVVGGIVVVVLLCWRGSGVEGVCGSWTIRTLSSKGQWICAIWSHRVPELPTVSLVFQGAEMRVSGDGLLYRVSGEVRGHDSVYCFTFGNSDLLGIEAYVIHHHQQNVWMEFDLEKSRIGLAQTGMVDWGHRVMVVLAGSRPLNQLTASNGDPLIERWSIVGSEMSI